MVKHILQQLIMVKNTFGERLKEERTRLGLTQEALGAVGGVKKLSQFTYEQDQRFPDAEYLIALASIGVDIQYVMLGKPSVATLSNDEGELLVGYRSLDIRGKAGVLGMIDGMSAPPHTESKTHVELHGNVGQQVTGDIKSPQTFTIGGAKKKKPSVSD